MGLRVLRNSWQCNNHWQCGCITVDEARLSVCLYRYSGKPLVGRPLQCLCSCVQVQEVPAGAYRRASMNKADNLL